MQAIPAPLLQLSIPEQVKATRQLRRLWQRDPACFIHDVLGADLWEKQQAIAQSVADNKRTAVKSCHGSGKTFLGGQLVPWFLYCFEMSQVVTTAPTYRQVVKLLWSEVRRAHKRAKIPLGGDLLVSKLRLADGWEAEGYTSDDPTAFQGVHSETGNVFVLVDEAAGVERPILEEGIEGILVGSQTRLMQIGNPTDPASAFADEFRRPGCEPFTISAFDTPNLIGKGPIIPGLIDTAWVLDKETRWGVNSPAYQARVLGEFPDVGTDNVYQMKWLERAFARDDLVAMPWEPVDLGVDVAREGQDTTVIYARQGALCWKVFKGGKQSTMATVGRVQKIRRELREQGFKVGTIRVDDVGVGGGVSDRLIELGAPVVKVVAGSTRGVDKVRFLNLRAQLAYQLRDKLEHGHIQLKKDDDLFYQATTIKQKIRSEGRIKIESKEEIKADSRPSPDDLDALILAQADGIDALITYIPDDEVPRELLELSTGGRVLVPTTADNWFIPT